MLIPLWVARHKYGFSIRTVEVRFPKFYAAFRRRFRKFRGKVVGGRYVYYVYCICILGLQFTCIRLELRLEQHWMKNRDGARV